MRKRIGIIRELPADDPRNIDHPCHDEQWLELARTLGRAMADRDWDNLKGEADESRRDLCPVFERPAKGSID
jgi:hypothetical protein